MIGSGFIRFVILGTILFVRIRREISITFKPPRKKRASALGAERTTKACAIADINSRKESLRFLPAVSNNT